MEQGSRRDDGNVNRRLPAELVNCFVGLLLGGLSLIAAAQAQESDGFVWPNRAQAAVSLTYDDGLDEHLDKAVPDLEAWHFRATFFVPGNSKPLAGRLEEWRQIARRGHEIGNHSLFHPCNQMRKNGQKAEWVWPEFALERYTVRQMELEVRIANILFTALDNKEERTFAYPCGDLTVNGESYVGKIKTQFVAARVDGAVITDMRQLDPYQVPSIQIPDNAPASKIIAFVEEAAAKGGLAVLVFHGLDEGHKLSVNRNTHRTVLAYLQENRSRLWIDTFLSIMKHVRSERERLGSN